MPVIDPGAHLHLYKTIELIEHIATLHAIAISPMAIPLFRGLYSLKFNLLLSGSF